MMTKQELQQKINELQDEYQENKKPFDDEIQRIDNQKVPIEEKIEIIYKDYDTKYKELLAAFNKSNNCEKIVINGKTYRLVEE